MPEEAPALFRMYFWFDSKVLVPEMPDLDLLIRACGGQYCTIMRPSNGKLVIMVEFDNPSRTNSPKAEKEAIWSYLEDTKFFDNWELSDPYILDREGAVYRQFFI